MAAGGRPLGRRGKAIQAIALVTLTIAIGLLPYLIHVGAPTDGLTLATARFIQTGENTERVVSLPHRWTPENLFELTTGTYRLAFRLETVPDEPLFIFIPAARHQVETWVNGQRADPVPDTAWPTPTSGYSFLARIPRGTLHAGDNELVVRQTRKVGWLPGRLSEVSIGTADQVMPAYRLSDFLIEEIRAMTFALHIALTIGIATIWITRRHDAVFGWLATLSVTSILVVLTQAPQHALGPVDQFRSIALTPAVGLMAIGMALAIAGLPRPKWLVPAVVLLPLALLLLGQTGTVPFAIVGLVSACFLAAAYFVASAILAHRFAREENWDAAIMMGPCALTGWFALHDVLVVTGIHDAPFLHAPYARTLLLLAITVVLMGRLARSLNSLDNANETLRQQLAAQEWELVLMHEKEKIHANRMVREEERRRLMRDLHDGMSGHLVTIIALAEREGERGKDIEQAARAALDDLRLVVHSLDLGDGDLGVALAAFRERLEPQMRRLGIDLHWSTEKLPAVTGVTPQNALSVLRILQEAVTNAIRHGAARKLSIQGQTAPDGQALLCVFNDVHGTALQDRSNIGNGLRNMHRRARELGGHIEFLVTENAATLRLSFPPHLPGLQ